MSEGGEPPFNEDTEEVTSSLSNGLTRLSNHSAEFTPKPPEIREEHWTGETV